MLLNFPNNPTGYVPTPAEGEAIVRAACSRQAERGTKVVAVLDDAYFGLFYHLGGAVDDRVAVRAAGEPPPESARDPARRRHQGAVRLGPALRLPDLRARPRGHAPSEVCEVLDAKVRGAIRSGISNVPQLSQSLVAKALASSSIADERKQKHEMLRARAERVHEVANAPRFRESWEVYPFNSGYFMCVQARGGGRRARAAAPARPLRHRRDRGRGARTCASRSPVSSSTEIEPLFETLHRAIQELLA